MLIPYVNLHTHFIESKQVLSIFQASQVAIQQPFSAGLHPLSPISFHENILSHPNCVAIGECGLDRRSTLTFTEQIRLFEQQIVLSETFHLPVIIHCVKAWEEIRAIHRAHQPKMPWIFHGLSKHHLIEAVISEGLIPSFGTAILKNDKLFDGLQSLDEKKYFIETDDAKIHISALYHVITKRKRIILDDLKKVQYNQFKTVFTKWKNG
jgi:TatD DNase family protein